MDQVFVRRRGCALPMWHLTLALFLLAGCDDGAVSASDAGTGLIPVPVSETLMCT